MYGSATASFVDSEEFPEEQHKLVDKLHKSVLLVAYAVTICSVNINAFVSAAVVTVIVIVVIAMIKSIDYFALTVSILFITGNCTDRLTALSIRTTGNCTVCIFLLTGLVTCCSVTAFNNNCMSYDGKYNIFSISANDTAS